MNPKQGLALFEMARSGNVAALRRQLEGGLSVALRDDRGATPLHYAAW